MADEDEGVELSVAPITAVQDAGYLVAMTSSAGDPTFQRVAASEIGEIAQKAASAVQPTDLGSAAFADTESFITPTALEDALSVMQAQINTLTELIAAGGGSGGGGGGGQDGTLPATLPFILGGDPDPEPDLAWTSGEGVEEAFGWTDENGADQPLTWS